MLVVPELHRVFATATGDNRMASIDEDTGVVLYRTPTGEYPDGLAYDPKRSAIWTTNETGGSETVIGAADGAVRGTVDVGGEAGDVAYNPATDQMLVAVQGRGDLAVVDPAAMTVSRRIACRDAITPTAWPSTKPPARRSWRATATPPCSVSTSPPDKSAAERGRRRPDVLAYDAEPQRLYVAAESGEVTVLDRQRDKLMVIGSAHLADGAHVVAIDPATKRATTPFRRVPTVTRHSSNGLPHHNRHGARSGGASRFARAGVRSVTSRSVFACSLRVNKSLVKARVV